MKCAECGKPATKLNFSDQPVCSKHVKTRVKMPKCPNCKLNMVVRTGKFGAFWGCMAFPMCDGIKKI
ncbi:topoisomerase DNA-binding C4 zinc finger domain-containing protein [archaeon]|nr:topoisomerase DNA-binding C4 zinc finger domain-containing protein [archaeon]